MRADLETRLLQLHCCTKPKVSKYAYCLFAEQRYHPYAVLLELLMKQWEFFSHKIVETCTKNIVCAKYASVPRMGTSFYYLYKPTNTKHLYNIFTMLVNVFDVDRALYKCYTNVLCLLASCSYLLCTWYQVWRGMTCLGAGVPHLQMGSWGTHWVPCLWRRPFTGEVKTLLKTW